MAFLEKLRFNLWDGKEMVERLVDEWKPRRCATEKDYEKSLYKFLHEKFEEIQITKQYARGRIRADIVVGDKIIVELKNNLNTTNKYQRLLGQLAQYKEWDGPILVILCGDTDKNLWKDLNRQITRDDMSDDLGEPKITLFQK